MLSLVHLRPFPWVSTHLYLTPFWWQWLRYNAWALVMTYLILRYLVSRGGICRVQTINQDARLQKVNNRMEVIRNKKSDILFYIIFYQARFVNFAK